MISSIIASFTYAGCGSCNVNKRKSMIPKGEFVTKAGLNGKVNGLVLASCGMCNFGKKDKDCILAIQINDKAYNVKGTNIDDHGDSHAKDGFCNAVRIAKVDGEIEDSTFFAETFVLQKN